MRYYPEHTAANGFVEAFVLADGKECTEYARTTASENPRSCFLSVRPGQQIKICLTFQGDWRNSVADVLIDGVFRYQADFSQMPLADRGARSQTVEEVWYRASDGICKSTMRTANFIVRHQPGVDGLSFAEASIGCVEIQVSKGTKPPDPLGHWQEVSRHRTGRSFANDPYLGTTRPVTSDSPNENFEVPNLIMNFPALRKVRSTIESEHAKRSNQATRPGSAPFAVLRFFYRDNSAGQLQRPGLSPPSLNVPPPSMCYPTPDEKAHPNERGFVRPPPKFPAARGAHRFMSVPRTNPYWKRAPNTGDWKECSLPPRPFIKREASPPTASGSLHETKLRKGGEAAKGLSRSPLRTRATMPPERTTNRTEDPAAEEEAIKKLEQEIQQRKQSLEETKEKRKHAEENLELEKKKRRLEEITAQIIKLENELNQLGAV